MGCGRSTLGSDSPRRNSKTTDDDETEADERDSDLHRSPPSSSSTHGSPLSFSSGGQLLAQSKLSESQVDFFKMLEEKIENGPDYDSEEEGILYQDRLQNGLRQWRELFQGRKKRIREHSADSQALLKTPSGGKPPAKPPTSRSPKSASTEEEVAGDSSDPESLPGENVKEQYVFMGNVYTLTRLRTDGTHVPHVDVSPAPVSPVADPAPPTSVSTGMGICKVNGAYSAKSSAARTRRLQRSDTPAVHQPVFNARASHARPASLVLRTVFQNQETEATS